MDQNQFILVEHTLDYQNMTFIVMVDVLGPKPTTNKFLIFFFDNPLLASHEWSLTVFTGKKAGT